MNDEQIDDAIAAFPWQTLDNDGTITTGAAELMAFARSVIAADHEGAAREIERLYADNERIRDWLSGDAECPCCQESAVCQDGCTFEQDCPNESARMRWVRHVLAGA